MLARKNRNTEGEQRSCRNCNFDQQKFSESPSRKLYHSPVKKRRQLAMRPPWKLSLSTRPSLRWDPFSGRTEYNGYVFSRGPTSGARGSLLSRSPVKKGILKNPDVAARAVYKNRKSAPVRGIVIRNHREFSLAGNGFDLLLKISESLIKYSYSTFERTYIDTII